MYETRMYARVWVRQSKKKKFEEKTQQRCQDYLLVDKGASRSC